MNPSYSHTYQSCVFSMKRERASWQVVSSYGNYTRLFTGRHYELPNKTVCLTCQTHVPEADH